MKISQKAKEAILLGGVCAIAYLAVYLFVSNGLFYICNIVTNSTDTVNYFNWVRYLLILTTPILAMKLFPEERKNKTDQLLITAPVSITGMVMGKFLAAYTLYIIGIIPTIFNMLFRLKNATWKPVLFSFFSIKSP